METIDVISDELVEHALIKEVPLSFAKGNLIMPLNRADGLLKAVVADEKGLLALRELAMSLGLMPAPVMSSAGAVIDAINRYYGQMGSAEEV
ncbi:MAG: type II secretion system protein GspE, partial [Nitrospirae bacterium]